MATNIEKHVWLVDILRRNSKGLTFQEISSLWTEHTELNPFGSPMQKKTFHRYQNDILDIYGIAIKCNRSDYKYYIDYNYCKKEDEVSSWLLNTISMDNMIRENRSLQSRILLERQPGGENYLPLIMMAMKESCELEITYCSFTGEEPYSTTLAPYFVKVFARRWYVIGMTPRHPGELRTYSLDRITGLQKSEKKFSYPKDFIPSDYFSNSFGIFHGEGKVEHIELRIFGNQRKYVRSLPLHESQKEIETDEESSIFTLELEISEDFIREIMRNGADFEVLEPQSLRAEIEKRIFRALNRYGNSKSFK